LNRIIAILIVMLKEFLYNDKGEMDASEIIMAVIALFLIGVLGPVALEQIYSANTTGWNAAVKTIFQVLLPVLAIIGLSLYFLRKRD